MTTAMGPLSLPDYFSRQTAATLGVRRRALERLESRGVIRRVGHGVYSSRAVIIPDGPRWQQLRDEHLLRCRDLQARHPGHAVSHISAAVAHGLATSLHPDESVHLTSIERVPRSRRSTGARFHHADSMLNEATLVDGIRVTSLARTIADTLRFSRVPNGVALLDQAIRQGRTDLGAVQSVLDQQRRWLGRPRALAALELADPRRESWLESYSFATLTELGIELPVPQVDILDAGLSFVGRVDGLLPGSGVFLEADGQEKYLLAAREGRVSEAESIRQSMKAQGVRHDLLEALGLVGVRWTPKEIRHQDTVVARRVARAVAESDPSRFRGWVRLDGTVMTLAALAALTGQGRGALGPSAAR